MEEKLLNWEKRPFVTDADMTPYLACDRKTGTLYGKKVLAVQIANIDYKIRFNKSASSRKMQPPPSCGRIFLGYLVIRKLGTPLEYETWMPEDVFEDLYRPMNISAQQVSQSDCRKPPPLELSAQRGIRLPQSLGLVMTKHAREVLEDCKVAAAEIKDGVTGREWRIKWVAAVALLRAVGHTLRKVDASSDQTMEQLVSEAWDKLVSTKPEPKIFWQFIEDERNNILKEYRLGAGQGVTIRPGTLHVNLKNGEQWSEPGEPTLFHYKMTSGPYKGRDQRDVLNEAIDWWDAYLSNLERRYAETQP
ncbi:hypothetical protein [Methylobacter marinus]|uniref:hypothetical protein n=1 Tax=Methylobacter marinus TaxID=34058 RepID=UPI00037AD313|nr:hypothetical protein [Methylobacter marinus]